MALNGSIIGIKDKHMDLKEIQAELLEQIKEFDAVCTNNKIEYSLHGGSMLGAIRHKGFIPWDDDIDITMTKSNFLKFKEIVENEMPGYHLSDDVTPTARLMRKKYEGRPFVWIDILEYNYISENPLFQRIKIGMLVFMSGICRTKTTVKSSTVEKHGKIKVALLYLLCFFGQLLPLSWRINAYKYISRELFQGNKTLVHRTNDQVKSIHYILPKEVVEEYIKVPFENIQLPISKYYQDVLVKDFGPDYMTPPPENNRITHVDVVREMFVNLQREYEADN